MSASCKVSGIATARSGPVSTYWSTSSRSNADASSIFVSSSTYSGTPICFGHNVLHDLRRERFASGPLRNQRLDLRTFKTVEHEGGHVGALRPERAELWAI